MSQTNTRYDGDTWDLASSVGATATSVAASRALASRGPDALIHDPYADALVKAVGVESLIRVANGEAAFAWRAASGPSAATSIGTWFAASPSRAS